MKLFAWGANTYGQLGIGIKSELCAIPVEVSTLKYDPEAIKKLTGGGGHTLSLDKAGNIHSCGWNSKGQLGRPAELEEASFGSVTGLGGQHVVDISCGWDTSFALTEDGRLFGWGSNSYGQLGFPRNQVSFSTSPLQLMHEKVKQLSAGLRHTAIVSEGGHIFICGSGRKGQLGIVDYDQVVTETFELQKVLDLPAMKMVACGQNHTVGLSVCGRIFVWGDNKFGQLGFDPSEHPNFALPVELNCFQYENIPQGCYISCGWTHTILKTEDGKIFNWGRNNYGQLGCNEKQRINFYRPQLLEDIVGVRQIAVGSEHNVALLETAEVLCWGWNEHGNCATGTDGDVKNPKHVENTDSAVLIGTGAAHSFAVVVPDM